MGKTILKTLVVLAGIVSAVYFYSEMKEIFFLNLANILLLMVSFILAINLFETDKPKKLSLIGLAILIFQNILEIYLRSSGSLSTLNPTLNVLLLSLVPFSIFLILLNNLSQNGQPNCPLPFNQHSLSCGDNLALVNSHDKIQKIPISSPFLSSRCFSMLLKLFFPLRNLQLHASLPHLLLHLHPRNALNKSQNKKK